MKMTSREPPEDIDEPDVRIALTIGLVLGGLIVLAVAMYFGPPPPCFAP